MKINVTKDNVSIETKIENHYGEYNVNECLFVFDEHFNNVAIKRAVFSSQKDNKSFEVDIINNKCFIPHQVLNNVYDEITLGVYGYDISGDELLIRYSPEPTYFVVHEGSYKENTEKPEIITPSQYDMYSQALQEGLAEVDGRLDDVEKQGDYAKEQGNYAKEQGDYAKEQGTNAKNIAEETEKKAEDGLFNGKSLEFVWQGTKLGVRLEGQEEYQFVDLQGVQGEIGATGEPFKIKKTYASVSEMNADFRNMQFGDYVMIASSVEVEDNAKLYTRGESAWIFISDFSGAMGIRGETGLTPNIKIGEVKTLEAGSQAKVTRSGSNEEPVFNFEIPKGDKGDDYVLTEEDKIEIGEMVNTEYEERIAENEKDIIDIESYLDSLTPKAPPVKGELVHITDALNLPTFENKVSGNVKQETTKGYNLLNNTMQTQTLNGVSFTVNDDKSITIKGTATARTEPRLWTRDTNDTLVLKAGVTYYNKMSTTLFLFAGGYKSIYANQGFTPTEDLEVAYMYIRVEANETIDTTIYPLLTTDNNATYEPYTNGASPSPSYKQPIEVLEGYNLIDIQNNNWVYRNSSVTNANKAHQNYGNGIVIDYDYNNDINYRLVFIKYPFKADKYYCMNATTTKLGTLNTTISLYLPNTEQYLTIGKPFKPNSDTEWIGFYVETASYKEGLKYAITDVILQEVESATATPKPYVPYGCVGYKNVGDNILLPTKGIKTKYFIPKGTIVTAVGETLLTSGNIKFYDIYNNVVWFGLSGDTKYKTMYLDRDIYYIEKASSDSLALYVGNVPNKPYEPYKEKIVYLDLKGNWVGKINDNIKDYLVTDKKKLWLVKNVRKYTFTGSDEFEIQTDASYIRFLNKIPLENIKHTKDREMILSDHFKFSSSSNDVGTCFLYDSRIFFYPKDISTIEEFKQWLSENNVEVIYPLETPEIIELGELPEPIKTFEGANNIQILANLDTEIEVKYALDLKKYYDNKIAELSSQII